MKTNIYLFLSSFQDNDFPKAAFTACKIQRRFFLSQKLPKTVPRGTFSGAPEINHRRKRVQDENYSGKSEYFFTKLPIPSLAEDAKVGLKPHKPWQLIAEDGWFCSAFLVDATQNLSFILDQSNQELKEGDNVTLICEGDGNPPPEYTLFKMEVSLLSQTPFQLCHTSC